MLAVILTGLVILWIKVPALYGPSNEAKIATSNTRAGILTVVAALIAATVAGAAVWTNYQTLRATQRANWEAQRANWEAQRANWEAQRANREALTETQRVNREVGERERYATAIGQLGSNKRSVRLGAIYTLERIAGYSESDQRTVVEVLSAYIRENHPRSFPKKGGTLPESEDEKQDEAPRVLLPDEAAALTVLGRLPEREGVPRGDLRRTDFAHTDLTRACLSNANLNGADLSNANLNGADLSNANLNGANLFHANLGAARDLRQAQVNSARGDAKTELPAGLQRPSTWAGNDDE